MGGDHWYLFENGFVDAKRRRLRPVAWTEVSAITRKRMGRRARSRGTILTPQTLRGYEVTLKDGTRHFIMAVDMLDLGRDLIVQFEEHAARAGVRIYG